MHPLLQTKVLHQLIPCRQTGLVQFHQGLVYGFKRSGSHVERQKTHPWQQFGQITPINAQRPQRIEQHARQVFEHRRIGHGIHLLGGQVAGIAKRSARTDVLGFQQSHLHAIALQYCGDAQAYDATADDSDAACTHAEMPHWNGS